MFLCYLLSNSLPLSTQGYNRIPLALQLLADFDTPLSVYAKLANQPYSYLFESVHGGERWGRYSIIGLAAQQRLEVRGHTVQIYQQQQLLDEQTLDDPLAFIEQYQQQFKVPVIDGLPRFTGGLVGYFAYDTVRLFEKKLAKVQKPDPLNVPDIQLMLSEEVVVFDNLKESVFIIVHVDPQLPNAYQQGVIRLQQLPYNCNKIVSFYLPFLKHLYQSERLILSLVLVKKRLKPV